MLDVFPDHLTARLVDLHAEAFSALRAAGDALYDLAVRAEGDAAVDVDALFAGVDVAMSAALDDPSLVPELQSLGLAAAAVQARETWYSHDESACSPVETLTPLGEAASRARSALAAAVLAVHRAEDFVRALGHVRSMT